MRGVPSLRTSFLPSTSLDSLILAEALGLIRCLIDRDIPGPEPDDHEDPPPDRDGTSKLKLFCRFRLVSAFRPDRIVKQYGNDVAVPYELLVGVMKVSLWSLNYKVYSMSIVT